MRFVNELKIVKEKNPNIPMHKLIRLLFHGTRNNNPKDIAMQEVGLDMRYANLGGAYGAGIYFADNAAYSSTYGFAT